MCKDGLVGLSKLLLLLKVPMYSRNVWCVGVTNDRLRHKQLAAA